MRRLRARISATAGKAKIGGDGEVLQARVQEGPGARIVVEPVRHGNANIHAGVRFEGCAGAEGTPFLRGRVKIVAGGYVERGQGKAMKVVAALGFEFERIADRQVDAAPGVMPLAIAPKAKRAAKDVAGLAVIEIDLGV